MGVTRLYLDTNIVIALGEGKGEIADLLTELAERQQQNPTFLCTSEMTLAELLVIPYRDRNDELIARYEAWLVSGVFMEVGAVHRTVLRNAALLRSIHKTIKLPDALHIATAIGLGCTHMLTADTRLPSRIEMTGDPYGVVPASLFVLRPDASTLRQIIDEQRAL